MSTSGSRFVEDVKIGIRLKISALWIAVLLVFAYGDIFEFFAPGQIEEIHVGGDQGMGPMTKVPIDISMSLAATRPP